MSEYEQRQLFIEVIEILIFIKLKKQSRGRVKIMAKSTQTYLFQTSNKS